jgi:hypothetical protein
MSNARLYQLRICPIREQCDSFFFSFLLKNVVRSTAPGLLYKSVVEVLTQTTGTLGKNM